MAQIATTPRSIPASVSSQLTSLRRRIIAWFLIDGVGRLLGVVLGIVLFDLLIDRFLRMDVPQRTIMLVLATAAIAYLFWRWLVRPFLRRPGDDALVLKVEDRHADLGELLISSVQFSRMSPEQFHGVSEKMVGATIAQGEEAARRVNFSDTLNHRRFLLNLMALTLAAVGIGLCGFAIVNTVTGETWFQRNVMLQDVPWPGVHLLVEGLDEDGEMVVVRNDNWTVNVRAVEQENDELGKLFKTAKESLKGFLGFDSTESHGGLDLRVLLDFEGARPSQQMKKVTGDEQADSASQLALDNSATAAEATNQNGGRQLARFDAQVRNVTEAFQFRARAEVANGPDHSTRWISVNLVEPPGAIEQAIEIIPPKYTGDAPYLLPPGQGPTYVLDGSSMSLRGKANKPLAEAVLRLKPLNEGTSTRQWKMSISNENEFSVSVPAGDITTAAYEIVFTDSSGLRSTRPDSFGLRLSHDQSPRVDARLVGITRMVVPGARIPFWTSASDKYAVDDVWIRYLASGGSVEDSSAELRFESMKDQLGKPDVTFEDVWELSELNLETGVTLTFNFYAKDNDDYTKDKDPGKSKEYLLRVVTEEELRTDLLRREKELRAELNRLIETQDTLWTDTRALAADLSSKPEMTDKQMQEVQRISARQKGVGDNTESIARRLRGFIAEILNNRLEEEGGLFQQRLEDKIIEPLSDVAEVGIPGAKTQLDIARRLSDNADERDAALESAAQQQEQVLEILREVMVHMVKAEGYQEAVNALYEVEKAERGVSELTEKRREELRKEIIERLEKEGQGGTEPKNDNP